ncbi:MAG: Antitoxin EndoAI [Pelotomaculum sp. PtaB.Bin117]|nr:MAG: Antitoxin EndoAI [Pelotomaculum sp. PtaB.Bin117]OPY62973.1 MAG: Antitoxin EndoAI [Pelotomaculum sp. PtaU1.Bin065]
MVPRVKKIIVSLPDPLLAEVDRIAAAEQISRSDVVGEAVKLYIEDWRRRLFIEQMKKGYIEMANINLALAIEHYRLESEVTQKFELPGTEVK